MRLSGASFARILKHVSEIGPFAESLRAVGRRIGAVRKINGWLYGASGRKFYKLARLAQIQLELLSQAHLRQFKKLGCWH